MIRTHDAGSLRAEHVGETVTLAGWVARRRDHGGVAFIDLRDASGVVQVVVRDEEVAHPLRSEFCVKVTGEVAPRPEGNANPEPAHRRDRGRRQRASRCSAPPRRCRSRSTSTSRWGRRRASAPLPRPAPPGARRGDPAAQPGQPGRPRRARRARLRRDRDADADPLDARGRPRLPRAGAAAARAAGTPCRRARSCSSSCSWSPGMERYYQIARCYRDEDFRADRQPEFTQLDIEMSFVDQDDVIAVGEEVAVGAVALDRPRDRRRRSPRMTYAEAMARYGSDKPDLRFGLELVECTDYFAETPFRVFQAPYVGAVVMPGGAVQPRKQLDAWQEWAKQRGAQGLAYVARAGGRRARRPGRQEPLRRRAGRPGRARRRRSRATASSSPPGAVAAVARAARGRPPRDRPPLRADRRGGLGVRVGRRRAAVRAASKATASRRRRGRRRCLDRRAPRLHLAQARVDRHLRRATRATRWPTPTTSSATATRSAAGRSVSTAATSRSGSSR